MNSNGLQLDLHLPFWKDGRRLQAKLQGKSLGIQGPSGSGKTSILRCVAGFPSLAEGAVSHEGTRWLDSAKGVCVAPEQRNVGLVPQDNLLFPHLTVAEHLCFGRNADKSLISRWRDILQLESIWDRPVTNLSGGEKKRVAIGRVAVQPVSVLLFDEPFAGVDWDHREQLIAAFQELMADQRLATIIVSHDPRELEILCDEVIKLPLEAERPGQ